jgi:hypothetical protein
MRRSNRAKKHQRIKYITGCKPTIADDDRFMTALAEAKKRMMIKLAMAVIYE